MPLLRSPKNIQKGDVIVNIIGFTDTWDHLYREDSDEWHLVLEICVSKVEEVITSQEAPEIEVFEYGFLHFDPRSYLGYGYYHHKNNPCSYSLEYTDVLGIVNGQLDLQDKGEVKTFMKRMLGYYRGQIESVYFHLMDSDEELGLMQCL